MHVINTLLVDDSSAFLSAVVKFLAAFPHIRVVGQAQSGTEALGLIAQLRPELALVDLAMPQMNGLELTRRIKALANPPKVIMLTVATSPEYRDYAHHAGAEGFLNKDHIALKLMPRIDALFGGRNTNGEKS